MNRGEGEGEEGGGGADQGCSLIASMVMRFLSSTTKMRFSRSMHSLDSFSTAFWMWGISDQSDRTCCSLHKQIRLC